MRTLRYIGVVIALIVCIWMHAEVAVYTVTSYHDIALTEGVAPVGSTATFFSTTARSTQITAGNDAEIVLSGYDGLHIISITLYMHSNQSSGRGSLQVSAGDSIIAVIADAPFADEAWNGAYVGGNEWVSIAVPMNGYNVRSGEHISIQVHATVNSLYLGGCRIHYREGIEKRMPKTVSFSTGTEREIPSITERNVGQGILLPSLPDADSIWRFLGWTETRHAHSTVCPNYYLPGTVYVPQSNMTLYALYTNGSASIGIAQDTTFESGLYAIVSGEPYNCMMCGSVVDRKVQTQHVEIAWGADSLYKLLQDTIPIDCQYYVTFNDSVATIQHEASGKWIGYYSSKSSKYLHSSEKEWNVMHTSRHSVFLFHDADAQGLMYGLHPNLNQEGTWYADTRLMPQMNQRFLLLFAVPDSDPEKTLYTTNPLSGVHLDNYKEWKPLIKNGVLYNPSRETLRIYSLQGQIIRYSQEDIYIADLPTGLYIICSSQGSQIIKWGK